MDKGEETRIGYALFCEEGCCISHVICEKCRLASQELAKLRIDGGGDNHE
ncbi:MAG: hypothetical protein HYX88_02280 [Chloroflexi bacterium]|nr:hypothetical protein [Chloroflexota bacterium]